MSQPVLSLTETSVLAANRAFYDAFAEHDAGAMDDIWAHDHDVACIHPGRGALRGRDAVIASWRAILGAHEPPGIEFTNAVAVVIGDVAVVTCMEHIGGARLAATNIFAIEHGDWRLVHHHAGPMASAGESQRPPPSVLN